MSVYLVDWFNCDDCILEFIYDSDNDCVLCEKVDYMRNMGIFTSSFISDTFLVKFKMVARNDSVVLCHLVNGVVWLSFIKNCLVLCISGYRLDSNRGISHEYLGNGYYDIKLTDRMVELLVSHKYAIKLFLHHMYDYDSRCLFDEFVCYG